MKTKNFFLTIILLAIAESVCGQLVSEYHVGQITGVQPYGWLQIMMQRQHDGLTGHPEALSYPYNTVCGLARYRALTRLTARTGGAMNKRLTIPTGCCDWVMSWATM